MKKTVSALLLLLGAMYYSQSSIFVFNNQNAQYDAVGRFFAGNIVPGNPVAMFAAPNVPGVYTMPSGIYDKYVTFDTSGVTGSGIMDINKWYVSDYLNPVNSGTYNYNDPFITANMNPNNEWAGFIFALRDISSGNTYDDFRVGNPAVASNVGFTVVPYQVGTTTGVKADWYTITSGSDQITFFTIYP